MSDLEPLRLKSLLKSVKPDCPFGDEKSCVRFSHGNQLVAPHCKCLQMLLGHSELLTEAMPATTTNEGT